VDEMSWDDMHKNDMVWPLVSEVKKYKKEVYDVVSEIIQTHPSLDDQQTPVTIDWDHPLWALFMSIEHERIHLETSSVLFREMPIEHVRPPEQWPKVHPSVLNITDSSSSSVPVEGKDFPSNEMIDVKGGWVELGKPRDFPTYGWDNEYGYRKVEVSDFSASKHMVTNGEFFQFVKAGGYQEQQYWSEEGWEWRKFRNMKWPFFWKPHGPEGLLQFRIRTIFEEHTMQWDWPVDVNFHEATAYCNWKSEQDGMVKGAAEAYRVITESEHNIIRGPVIAEVKKDHLVEDKWAGNANFNLLYSSQSPVGVLPPSNTGHYDTMGNAWEWTLDHFNPLEGFKLTPLYEDFSTPCFDGRHNMIMGGSFISTGAEATTFARFHFRPHFLQHSGFRLVSSESPPPNYVLDIENNAFAALVTDMENKDNVYESDELVHQYLGMHFGQDPVLSTTMPPIFPHNNAPNHALQFPQRLAKTLAFLLKDSKCSDDIMDESKQMKRALDVGCAVGGGAFELALHFDDVVAFDFSEAFIQAAQKLKCGETLRYQVQIEGDIYEESTAQVPPHVNEAARGRVEFKVGDACQLATDAKELGSFDGVIASNLICRLPDPLKFLDGLERVVKPNGVVILATPFSWLEQYTGKERWMGGFNDEATGEAVRSKEVLEAEMLSRGFIKIHEEQMPFLIREHQRKYQYVISEVTGWKQKAA